jgi:hypothetical protein
MNRIDQFFGPGASLALEAKHKPRFIDRSDLEAFASCPHQGQLRKKHPELQETHDELPMAGTFVHDLAKTAVEACDKDLQEAADYIDNELPKGRPDLQPEILRAGKYLAIQLRQYRVQQVLMCDDQQISRTLIPESTQAGELIITTKPDLVLATRDVETLHVLDYKGGWLERSNADAADEFQTCVICWCLFAKYVEVQKIHFWYIQTRKGTRAYARIGREQELNFEARIFEAARLYDEGCDEAWPSEKKCSICPVVTKCRYAEEICAELNGDVKAFVDNTIVLEEKLARRQKVISEALKSRMALCGSGGRYDTFPKKKPAHKASYKENKEEAKDD